MEVSARLRRIMPLWFLSTDPGYARVAPDPGGAFTPVAAFSTRRGGVSAAPWDTLNLSEGVGDDASSVRVNRERLLSALGLDPAAIAYATQVHGARVLAPGGPGLAGTGDALVTRNADVVLAIGAADCLPLLAWDRAGRAVAAMHAGWRGLVAGVVPQTLSALSRIGVLPSDLTFALGPRIGPCCFAVGADVAARFDTGVVHGVDERTTIDLAEVARHQLATAGVETARVRDLGHCTACDAGSWFSHRRDRGRTGRAWGLVSLRPAGPRTVSEEAV
jgi:purine-nucleoside/S-methyl-5'-thioadenosine phosphorylase / adenosine deaminase